MKKKEEREQLSSSKNIEDIFVAGSALVAAMIIGMVAHNFAENPEIHRQLGWGRGFATSQRTQDEARATPTHSPEGQKCAHKCSGPCKNGHCLDQQCGQMIPCSTREKKTPTHIEHDHGTDSEGHKCSGKCAPGIECDKSHHTCWNQTCRKLIQCLSGEPGVKCDPKAPCDTQGFCVGEKSGLIIRCKPKKTGRNKPTYVPYVPTSPSSPSYTPPDLGPVQGGPPVSRPNIPPIDQNQTPTTSGPDLTPDQTQD